MLLRSLSLISSALVLGNRVLQSLRGLSLLFEFLSLSHARLLIVIILLLLTPSASNHSIHTALLINYSVRTGIRVDSSDNHSAIHILLLHRLNEALCTGHSEIFTCGVPLVLSPIFGLFV
jgi:hypothetical protein